MLVSSSRDTTVRFWTMRGSVTALLVRVHANVYICVRCAKSYVCMYVPQVKCMLLSPLGSVLGEVADVMKPGERLRLCGAASRKVLDEVNFHFSVIGPRVFLHGERSLCQI